jgi:hypothetical protein
MFSNTQKAGGCNFCTNLPWPAESDEVGPSEFRSGTLVVLHSFAVRDGHVCIWYTCMFFPIYVICVWYVCVCANVCICSCNCMQLHATVHNGMVCNCMYACVCVCVCVCSAYFLVYFPQAYLSETGDPKPSEIPYFLPEIDSSGVSNSDKYRGNDTHLEAGNSHIFHFGISRRIMSFHMEYTLVI